MDRLVLDQKSSPQWTRVTQRYKEYAKSHATRRLVEMYLVFTHLGSNRYFRAIVKM